MKYLTWPIALPVHIFLAIWTWLWSWTYPLARPSIAEARLASAANGWSIAGLIESVRFTLHLPLMARAQHYAERSALTGSTTPETAGALAWKHASHMRLWRSEKLWRMRLREAMVWSTLASWLVTWASIGASVIFTGNFLFEVHETPDAAGYVSNYFKVAALTFVLSFALVTTGLTALGVTRKAGA